MARRSRDGVGEAVCQTRRRRKTRATPARKKTQAIRRSNASREGRPPLRRASLDTSPPIDGGEERRDGWRTRDSPLLPEA
ncbi:hypothetical protein FJ937_04860 [Mesorhizobium sp. B2-4-4]|nr:hypothetical protein FJ937_04860 [Mesorhizobium sp. B2-4-4]